MKRRNVDCSKLRRPPKRAKITDGIYGSIFVYLKLFLVWALFLMFDFIVDFRFEYLWPLWLLTQSLYDSFKYQGLAFSIFFVCITITSDVACYLFIPVQWLFLTASTYVWVQYVWQTERGITVPTVLLWVVFLYVEVMVRLRDLKDYPFHIDLCRPFAAHCAGYPVITMGFSVKSCISHRFRLIKQKDVERENEFYMQLLYQALPPQALQLQTDKTTNKALTSRSSTDPGSTSEILPLTNGSATIHTPPNGSASSSLSIINPIHHRSSTFWSICRMIISFFYQSDGTSQNIDDDVDSLDRPDDDDDNLDDDDACNSEITCRSSLASNGSVKNNVTKVNNHIGSTAATTVSTTTVSMTTVVTTTTVGGSKKTKSTNVTSASGSQMVAGLATSKDNNILSRLESDVRRLRAELQCSRNAEVELRAQLSILSASEKSTKTELHQLRQDNENLQTKLHKLVTGKQQDKQNLSQLEKRLQEEKKQRTAVEQQVAAEKRRKSEESAAAAAASAAAASNRVPSAGSRGECTLDSCKTKRWELENELKQARRDVKLKEDQLRLLERETQTLQQYRESQTEAEVLMSALGAMQDKNTHLENSLSAETRLKLDLFSALGEAKRQIEIQQALLIQKEVELADLKSKVAEVMAFMPSSPVTAGVVAGGSGPQGIVHSPYTTSNLAMRYSPSFANCGVVVGNSYATTALTNHVEPPVNSVNGDHVLNKSVLNPSASDYTPNVSQ